MKIEIGKPKIQVIEVSFSSLDDSLFDRITFEMGFIPKNYSDRKNFADVWRIHNKLLRALREG